MFRTPKRNQQRPPEKGHKAEQDEDIKGVGVRGEVTPESCSTSNDPSLMRANAATRHERSGRSEPYAKPKHESSERPEDAFLVMGPEHAVPAAEDSEDTLMRLQNPVSEDQLRCIDERSSPVAETCSEDSTNLKSAKEPYAKGNDQGLVAKDNNVIAKNEDEMSEVSEGVQSASRKMTRRA